MFTIVKERYEHERGKYLIALLREKHAMEVDFVDEGYRLGQKLRRFLGDKYISYLMSSGKA